MIWATSSFSTAVRAAPSEAPAQVALNRATPDTWVVRYEGVGGGLLISEDAGQSWKLTCNDALASPLTRTSTVAAVASNGALFAASLKGMWRVEDAGCATTQEPTFEGRWVSDMVVDPSDPRRVYAVTSSSGEDNGLYRYDTDTGEWELRGALEPLALGSLNAVPLAEGVRLYETVLASEPVQDPETGEELQRRYVEVRRSDDEGETWTSFRALRATQAREVRVVAVDPENPERLALAEIHGAMSRALDVLWLNDSEDDPEAFRAVAEFETFGGAVFGEAGALWISDADRGIARLAPGEARPVEVVRNARARCLTRDAERDAILACLPFSVAVLEPDGTLRDVLDFRTVSQWVTCEGGLDVAASCEARLSVEDGWCTPTHYPEAPVCGAYCYPGLDEAARPDDGACGPVADAGVPSTPDADAAVAGDASMADEPEGGAAQDPTAEPTTDARDDSPSPEMQAPAERAPSGGCAATSWRTNSVWALPFVLMVALARVRRRAAAGFAPRGCAAQARGCSGGPRAAFESLRFRQSARDSRNGGG